MARATANTQRPLLSVPVLGRLINSDPLKSRMSAFRKRLLDLARGSLRGDHGRTWKCFPLESKHIGKPINDPKTFHRLLCGEIRQAQSRVQIVSLYVGPGVHPIKYDREIEFLQAWGDIKESVDVRILLDRHRALRPVPVPDSDDFTTSAEACRMNITNDSKIYLLSVLEGSYLDYLPNPLNEIAGVFHVKLYVIDDQVFLSGANLSQEYFSDRHDRYLWLKGGASGLVDMYVDLIGALCEFGSSEYVSPEDVRKRNPFSSKNRAQLFDKMVEILTTDE